MKETNPKRQLRSVDSNLETTLLDHEREKDLFDFDPYLREKIPLQLPIFVSTTDEDDYDEFLHRGADIEVDQKALNGVPSVSDLTSVDAPANKKRRVHRSKSLKQQRQYMKNDPLGDEVYAGYHNRMEREEKRMANLDKSYMASEFDKFSEQLKTLNVTKYKQIIRKGEEQDDDDDNNNNNNKDALYSFLTNPFDDIPRKLSMVTKINDIRDYKELRLKYRLTIKELNDFVTRYLRLKRQELEFKVADEQGHDDEDEDDDEDQDLRVEELQRKRMRLRNSKYGPIWKIIFYNCILIIDPVHPPKIRSSY